LMKKSGRMGNAVAISIPKITCNGKRSTATQRRCGNNLNRHSSLVAPGRAMVFRQAHQR
jgi:hypothetical protein